jgi:hypothetical protein
MLEAADQPDPSKCCSNATSTKPDYEGQVLTKKLAQWLMREAVLNGYPYTHC